MKSVYKDRSLANCPNQFNLAEYVLEKSCKNPTKSALEIVSRTGKQSVSFDELKNRILRTGNNLIRVGLKPEDKILLRLGNTVTFPIAYLGAISVGIIPVPTSSSLTKHELIKLIKVIEPKAIITSEPLGTNFHNTQIISETDIEEFSFEGRKAKFKRGNPNRLAYIVFTSGTSNTPRGVQHAHRAIWARKSMHSDWYSLLSLIHI